MTKKIALIDGYGFVFRAYHSLPPLTRVDGTPVGAVYGFTNMLVKLLAGLDVSHLAVVFDAGAKTFRNEIFSDYKANRPPCPEDLKPQFPIVRQAAESLHLPVLEKIGFEADDLIATIAKKAAAEGSEVLIISSDKDLMQLVGGHVFMYDAMKNKFIGEAEVREKFFVGPQQVIDVLSLIGDSSDNVPGVKGIGPKTAAELITQFGSLENLLDHLPEIKQEKRRQLLVDGVSNAKLSKELVTLKNDVPLEISFDDLRIRNLDPLRFLGFLEEQGFNSLISRVKKEFAIPERKTQPRVAAFSEVKKTEITSQAMLDEIAKQATLDGIATIDYHENFLTIATGNPKEIFYTKPNPESDQNQDLFTHQPLPTTNYQLPTIFLKNDSIKKILFDSKSPTPYPLPLTTSYEDLSLINHLLNSSVKHDLRELIDLNLEENFENLQLESKQDVKTHSSSRCDELDEQHFQDPHRRRIQTYSEERKLENAARMAVADRDDGWVLACFRNFAIYQLYQLFKPKIFELKLNNAYYSCELPLLQVLRKIESNGIKIDSKKLFELSQEFGSKINQLTREIYTLAGCEFNIASPKQLSEILFEKLGLTSSKKSKKTGALSTNAEVLEQLADDGYDIANKILEFRKFSKLKNTYTDALPKEINPRTGRVHTTLSSISTITGRLSSNNPNLQNIPIRTVEGKKIREAFVAEKGNLLISADYSQIELRVIAHVAKIHALTAAFKSGQDIHKITAAEVFKISEEEVDDEMRFRAKAINFGIIYGISAFGLAKQLGISRDEAKSYIESYLATYPGIDEYMKGQIALTRQRGYVETIFGRKCFIHEINNKNPLIRQEAERLAINAPIQGSAADIIKKAMLRVNKALPAPAKMVLQIHDELLVEAPTNDAGLVAEILRKEMTNAVALDVPLVVDVKIGERWV